MSSQTTQTLDVELERQERLQELQTDHGPGWESRYQPGSFGCHELLDRTHLTATIVEHYVLEHPSCVQNKDWYALAEQAVTALNELYQRIGAEHLGVDEEPTTD